MSTECIEKANRYFIQRTKKVYIERCTKIESFEEYLGHRYRDNCYYYSAFKIQDGFWQFKYIAMNTDKDDIPYLELIANDKNNGHVPSALMLARVVINKYNSEITRFIAYSEPSC